MNGNALALPPGVTGDEKRRPLARLDVLEDDWKRLSAKALRPERDFNMSNRRGGAQCRHNR